MCGRLPEYWSVWGWRDADLQGSTGTLTVGLRMYLLRCSHTSLLQPFSHSSLCNSFPTAKRRKVAAHQPQHLVPVLSKEESCCCMLGSLLFRMRYSTDPKDFYSLRSQLLLGYNMSVQRHIMHSAEQHSEPAGLGQHLTCGAPCQTTSHQQPLDGRCSMR